MEVWRELMIYIKMMQENSSDPMLWLWGIDALKVKSIFFEANDFIYNIRVENLDELKNLLRAGARLVCNKVGVIPTNKNTKNHTEKGEL